MRFYGAFLSVQLCLLVFITSVESRQMCWTCQYVQNGAGKDECALAPGNWSGGEPRMRCLFKCITSAEFDKVTGDPTFIFRGCADTAQKDGCTITEFKHLCYYSCDSGHYCNNQIMITSPLLAEKDISARPLVHTALLIMNVVSVIFFCHIQFP